MGQIPHFFHQSETWLGAKQIKECRIVGKAYVREQDCSNPQQQGWIVVNSSHVFSAFTKKPKNLGLEIDLHKPHEEREIVADIVAMPECANHEDIQGTIHFVFEGRAFIDTLPEPLLNCHVPIAYFLTNVRACLDDYYIAVIDSPEIILVFEKADPRRVDGEHAQFPCCVVLESEAGDG